MKVRLLYFAAVRELVGMDSEAVELPASVSTVAALFDWLPIRHEPLRGRLSNVRIARNESFAQPDDTVAEGDVLALIPPVAGG